MVKKGIDVSSYQGKPDWQQVARIGVEFAIIRILTKTGKDSSFEHNYAGCGSAGIKRGVYRYSYALNVEQARKEASEVLATLAGRKPEMGIWVDLEWSSQRALGSAKVKEISREWLNVIRAAGYECNVYCNYDWYKNVCGGLDAKYWIARYPSADNGAIKESLRPNTGEMIWQYSSKGSVPGIAGNVDMDIWYVEDMSDGDLKGEPGEIGVVPSEAVRSLQEALNAVCITDKNGNKLVADGIIGTLTESAIRKVVLNAGPFDAVRGRYTVGSTGPVVQWLQMQLNTVIGNDLIELLGKALEPDGRLGADTRLAIGLYQEMRGLKQDYIAGINTITALLAA